MNDLVKGVRDFPPDEMFLRNKVFSTIKKVYESYGYLPFETPAFEKLSILKRKSGEEIAGQLFEIKNADYALRFDLTIPFARYVSNSSMPLPFKRYCISRVWRREEPQKGRYREFYQADIDIAGSKSIKCEAELIDIAIQCLIELGFNKFEISVHVNHRAILDNFYSSFSLPQQNKAKFFRILDKLDKIGLSGVQELLSQEFSQDFVKKVKEFLSLSSKSNQEILYYFKGLSEQAATELSDLLDLSSFASNIRMDPSLVRGLDYYTGSVFEIRLSKEIGSCGGGGRYDNLLGLYGQDIPAVGISLGIERIIFLLKQKNKHNVSQGTRIFIADFPNSSKQDKQYIQNVAKKLRELNLVIETNLTNRSLKKQLDYCNARSIPFCIILGSKEREDSTINLKNMKTGESFIFTFDEQGLIKLKEYVRKNQADYSD